MHDHSITPAELVLILLIAGGPFYAAAFVIQAWRLTRSSHPRRAAALVGGLILAPLLTLILWWLSSYIPVVLEVPIPGNAGWTEVARVVALPAMVASLLSFSICAAVTANQLPGSFAFALQRLQKWVELNPGWGFRIYRTRSG